MTLNQTPTTLQNYPLYSLIIRLTPVHSGRLPATNNDLAHAAFLGLIEHIDPPTAQAIHDHNGRNPFTLSPLYGHNRISKKDLEINAGEESWLRVTLLDPDFFHLFIHYFLTSNQYHTIQLGKIPFVITHILHSPESSPLVQHTTLGQLADQANHHPIITLNFDTLTTFNLRGDKYKRQILFPDPTTLFGKLAFQWDRLTGQNTMPLVEQYAAECGLVKQYDLQTQMAIIKKKPQIGFHGRITYQFKDQKQLDYIAHLNRLADLALFTGVGSRTGMGMGQVWRVEE